MKEVADRILEQVSLRWMSFIHHHLGTRMFTFATQTYNGLTSAAVA